jgi:hypothetical protein
MLENEKAFYNSPSAGFDGLFNWDFLLPIFGDSKIAPMDIDAMIERNDNILFMETKRDGADVKMGQRICYRSLHKRGGITLVYVWMKEKDGEKNSDEITMIQILKPDGNDWEVKEFFDFSGQKFLYDFVEKWWKNANENKYIIR